MSKVFVLIPVKDRWQFTRHCLSSFVRQQYKNYKIVVIDSGSKDGTQKFIREKFPSVTLIQGPFDDSWWWTRAIHEGVKFVMKSAQADDYILTMNNDCVVGPHYLNHLMKMTRHNTQAIVGSLMCDIQTRVIMDAGAKIDWKDYVMLGIWCGYEGELDVLAGWGTLIPVRVVRKIGNFNYKWLPHYGGDYEFSYRAKKRGISLESCHNAIVYNHTKATGLEYIPARRLSLSEFWQIAFNRKSKHNLLTRVAFTFLCCPKEYLLINFWRIIKKGVYLLSLTLVEGGTKRAWK